MIELERHIEILLLKSDCVIVPGLGGFVTSHIAARYDDNDNTFIPPLRTLGFNAKLTLNDSMLVQSYSEAYDIGYPEAFNRIENEVDELKQDLSNNGSYELTDIGTLYLNEDGNIEFTPCEAGILTPDLYSLSSFEMKRLGQQSQSRQEKKHKPAAMQVATTDVRLAQKNEPGETSQVSDNKSNKADKSRTIEIRISAIRNFVAAVIAVILFLALGTPVNENSGHLRTSNMDNGIIHKLISERYNNVRNTKEIDLTVPKSSKADKAKEQAKPATTTVLKPERKAEPAKYEDNKSKSYYCIVLASRVTRKNATTYAEQLNKQGLDKVNVLDHNNSIKVVYGNYPSESEAFNALNRLRSDNVFNDAWVYHVRN